MGQQLLWLQLVLEKTEPWRSLGELPAPQAQASSTSNPAAPVGPSLPRGPGSPWGRKGNAPALFLASFWPWRSRLEVPGSDPGPPSVPHQPGKAVLGQSPERDGQEHRPPPYLRSLETLGPWRTSQTCAALFGGQEKPRADKLQPCPMLLVTNVSPTPISNHLKGGQGHEVTYRPPSGSCRSCSAGDTDLALGQRGGRAQRQELG